MGKRQGAGALRRPRDLVLAASCLAAAVLAGGSTDAVVTGRPAVSGPAVLAAATQGLQPTGPKKCLGKGQSCRPPRGASCHDGGCSVNPPPPGRKSLKHPRNGGRNKA